MINFKTLNNQEIHVSKDTVKEIVFDENLKKTKVVTDKNEYMVDKINANHVIAECRYDKIDRLTNAINNLTNMIRARVH